VQETVAGVTTEYLVGEINPTGYAQVFAELSSTNGLLRGYEWGLQLIAQRDFSAGTFVGRISYYGLDGHGSVRYLTDPNGAITDAYDYDAFGNLIAQTGTTFNNYLFAGEQFDPALGVYYNRARYYDHRQGRFWTRDPAFGRVTRPDSFHPYSYASLNPINRKDPTGLVTIAEEDVAIAENQTVQAIPLPSVAQEVIAIARPEVIAEAPQVFGLLAKTIAWLSIGTIAFGTYFGATSGGGGVPTDQAVAEANSNNYDIYRFGNAQGPAKLRAGYDYYLNSGGLIDPQNPMSSTFAGASAYRDPFHNDVKQLGLNGVLWRVGLQNVLIADGLSVIADGKDVKPDSTLPTGHHTIFPTIQMTSDDFEQRIRSLPWERSGRVK